MQSFFTNKVNLENWEGYLFGSDKNTFLELILVKRKTTYS